MRKDIRDNTRVMIDDPELARNLFERAKPLLPLEWNGWRLLGFNERFRFYRYDLGRKFALHSDGCFLRAAGERSYLRFMIYLNDGFEGGATAFHGTTPLIVTPQRARPWCSTTSFPTRAKRSSAVGNTSCAPT
jgi:hypothetical protein